MEWFEGLTDCLGAQARFGEAIEACAGLRALAEKLGDKIAQARAWNGLAFLEERRGDNRASVQAAERASNFAAEAGESEAARRELLKAFHLKGWAFYRLGDAPAVLALAEQTQQLSQQLKDRRGLATSFKLHGVAHLQLGHFNEADRYFEQGLALSQELGDRRTAAAMWSNRGETARLRGNYHAAAELYIKALTIAREIGHRESELIYLNNLCGARLGLDQFAQAEADLRQILLLTGAAKSGQLSETHRFLSEAFLGQNKITEALNAGSVLRF